MLLQQLLNGISIGFTYVLVSIGLTMVYGVLKLLHFAHGVIYMVGAFAAMIGILYLKLPFLAAAAFAMLAAALAGYLVERLAYRPLRGALPITTLISGIGVAIFVENLFQIIFSSGTRAFPETGLEERVVRLAGGVTITNTKMYIIFVGIAAIALLYYFLKRTKMGVAMEAVSQDRRAAALMGVPVDRTVSLTFMIGSALAALAGVLVALTFNIMSPSMGSMPGLKAFCIVVLGGLGSIPGTIVGGLIIGVVESLSDAYMPGMAISKDAIAFVILIVILLVRPAGLFGRKIEKV